MSSPVREVDTVARFGGDEFVVLLGELDMNRMASHEQALGVAEKIRVSLDAPYVLRVGKSHCMTEVEHHCSASIGAVVFAGDQASQDEILKWADAAMYQAKDAGRNTIRFYAMDV
jgi:diguanylate cyclase (GGDEF)-like protein